MALAQAGAEQGRRPRTMNAQTYKETVYRFRIYRHDELPEAHKAEYRACGVDPDELWSLIWSFKNREDAERRLAACIEDAASWQTFKLVDGGEDIELDRPLWNW